MLRSTFSLHSIIEFTSMTDCYDSNHTNCVVYFVTIRQSPTRMRHKFSLFLTLRHPGGRGFATKLSIAFAMRAKI